MTINFLLNPDRVRECLFVLREMLNVDESVKFLNSSLKLNDILPLLQNDLANAILKNEDNATAILQWIAAAVSYVQGDTDEMPRVDIVWNIQPTNQ